MKFIVSFLLLGLLAAPAMAQRPHRGDFKKQDQRVEKHVGEKSCPKCAALEKRVAGLQKRLQEATKGRGKPESRGSRRGSRSGGFRGKHRGSRGESGRGRWTPKKEKATPKKPHGNRQIDPDSLKKLLEMRKKWASRVAGR